MVIDQVVRSASSIGRCPLASTSGVYGIVVAELHPLDLADFITAPVEDLHAFVDDCAAIRRDCIMWLSSVPLPALAAASKGEWTAAAAVPSAASPGLLDRRQHSSSSDSRVIGPTCLKVMMPLAFDHEGLRHAVDAPVDRDAVVGVGADPRRRDCRARRGTPPAFSGASLLVDAEERARRSRSFSALEQRMLVAAGDAPAGKDVDHRHLALERGRVEARRRPVPATAGSVKAGAGLSISTERTRLGSRFMLSANTATSADQHHQRQQEQGRCASSSRSLRSGGGCRLCFERREPRVRRGARPTTT